ncbi:Integrase core domain protein [Geobacillus sp. BCO2]|nr:Integrase core domain protein [Geobacillus sp. BCO2]
MIEGRKVKLSLFVATLGYSRMKYAVFTTSQDQEHLMECLIQSFQYFGGVPKKVLFDNMKTVTDGRERGVVKWNKRFSEFASYYGFIPKACRLPGPDKGKSRTSHSVYHGSLLCGDSV